MSPRPSQLAFGLALSLTPAVMACSGFTASDECEPGEESACESQCGPGTMHCQPDGSWGICQPETAPECLPGDYGECSIAEDAPPGLWFCSDDCHVGPCMNLCEPEDVFECEAQCGPGQRHCDNEGQWGACQEYVLPPCRPGGVEQCPTGGEGHRRCNDSCQWGVCDDGAPCTPGEVSTCGTCASQVCQTDGTWGPCEADEGASCSPGETEACEAPCGAGERVCSASCEWTECWETEPTSCHPGDRQICPTTLYCGIAFRVCNPTCAWTDCIEIGD